MGTMSGRLLGGTFVVLLGMANATAQGGTVPFTFEGDAQIVAIGQNLSVVHRDEAGAKKDRTRFYRCEASIHQIQAIEEKVNGTILAVLDNGEIIRITVDLLGVVKTVEVSRTGLPSEYAYMLGRASVLVPDGDWLRWYDWQNSSLHHRPERDIFVAAGATVYQVVYGGNGRGQAWLFVADAANNVVWQIERFSEYGYGQPYPFASFEAPESLRGVATVAIGHDLAVCVATNRAIHRFGEWGQPMGEPLPMTGIRRGSLDAYHSNLAFIRNEGENRQLLQVEDAGADLWGAPVVLQQGPRLRAVAITSASNVIVNKVNNSP